MNVLDLFSGIGGFSLGLERAGMRTVAFCERDEYCRAVLRKHWPDIPCFDDIHAIDAGRLDRLGPVDLVCGGFPCQPFSVAGRQKAQEDDRHLWPEMRRVIALARPAWVVGENVAGIIPLALDDVLADLESLGYAARPFVVPACAVDAHHRRDRVWIVGADTTRDGREQRRESSGEDIRESGCVRNDVADPERDQLRIESGWCGGQDGSGSAQPAIYGTPQPLADADSGERLRRGGPVQMGRIALEGEDSPDGGGQGTQWSPEPDVGRVAHGVPKRVDRLRCLGNAVVPQVVEEIGRAIMRIHHG